MSPGRELRLISWPYHNGLSRVGMGAGATRLAEDEPLRAGIEAHGWHVTVEEVEPLDESAAEVARVIELARRLARHVRTATEAGAFPLVLAGNCNSCLGTVAGVGAEGLGVVWFDAHADFDDPDENESGFFDVMGLAMLTGRGWRALRATIPGHAPIDERRVLLAAVRDLEPYQRARLDGSEVLSVPGEIDAAAFEAAVSELSDRVERVYLHVDLDSLDAGAARANPYAAPGGPALERLLESIALAGRRLPVAAAALTAFDPACDGDGRAVAAARRIAAEIAALRGPAADGPRPRRAGRSARRRFPG